MTFLNGLSFTWTEVTSNSAVQGIDSAGGTTSATFPFPSALQNLPRAFFRVEAEKLTQRSP